MTASTKIKPRLEFRTSEDWRRYVAANVPPEERTYTLLRGQIDLYLRFYEVRRQPIPQEFLDELRQIEGRSNPERTEAVEALNARIFAAMTRFLKEAAPPERGTPISETPRAGLARLLNYLEVKNPSFAVWAAYRRIWVENHDLPDWKAYVGTLFRDEEQNEMEFTFMMGQLGELLHQFRDRNLAIPALTFRRIWFLHHERPGTERNFHARMLVQELLEVLPACMSA
jgi:hypothetical protein